MTQNSFCKLNSLNLSNLNFDLKKNQNFNHFFTEIEINLQGRFTSRISIWHISSMNILLPCSIVIFNLSSIEGLLALCKYFFTHPQTRDAWKRPLIQYRSRGICRSREYKMEEMGGKLQYLQYLSYISLH